MGCRCQRSGAIVSGLGKSIAICRPTTRRAVPPAARLQMQWRLQRCAGARRPAPVGDGHGERGQHRAGSPLRRPAQHSVQAHQPIAAASGRGAGLQRQLLSLERGWVRPENGVVIMYDMKGGVTKVRRHNPQPAAAVVSSHSCSCGQQPQLTTASRQPGLHSDAGSLDRGPRSVILAGSRVRLGPGRPGSQRQAMPRPQVHVHEYQPPSAPVAGPWRRPWGCQAGAGGGRPGPPQGEGAADELCSKRTGRGMGTACPAVAAPAALATPASESSLIRGGQPVNASQRSRHPRPHAVAPAPPPGWNPPPPFHTAAPVAAQLAAAVAADRALAHAAPTVLCSCHM
jgi:hypothetical protein